MKSHYDKRILLLSAALLLTACGGNSLNEGKAKDAIGQALTGSMLCYPWASASPETAILFDKETEFLANIAKAGWVNVVVEPAKNVANFAWFSVAPKEGYAFAGSFRLNANTNLYVVRLTEKGRALHKPAALQPESGNGQPGLCSGQKTVTAIKRFSEPAADASGKIVSEVVFRYGFEGAGPEFAGLWETEKGKLPAGQEQVGVVQLLKTNNGWAPNSGIHYAKEKI